MLQDGHGPLNLSVSMRQEKKKLCVTPDLGLLAILPRPSGSC